MRDAALIWSPFADEDAARAALSRLLDERLVACGNIVPGMTSLFAWSGKPGEERECGLMLKTAADRVDAAMAGLERLYPYDQPSIMAWTVTATDTTVDWLERETRSD